MRQEVLCHDSGDLLEVVEHGKAWVLLALIRWAKPSELVVAVKRDRRSRLAAKTIV